MDVITQMMLPGKYLKRIEKRRHSLESREIGSVGGQGLNRIIEAQK